MESPGGYPESPLDQDDVVYPCKGCGEILEEGKAFELAGNRWHIDCFRCNTCGTLLDSDANLLLLGDGSLICNNCTYSCNACGNKIEDLAILTGDQAFCANCFRCRNCKRKIENLRYARTSQGIFCMSCHESLMARRRKKSKKPPNSGGVVPKVDKSLPALPPSAVSSFTPEIDTPPSEIYSEPATADVSPRPQGSKRNETSPSNFRRDASPASLEDTRRENQTLPASTYKEQEASDNGDDSILLPFALDINPAPGPSPLGKSRKYNEGPVEKTMEPKSSRDYFNRPTANHRDVLKENRPASTRSTSTERARQTPREGASPHIAYQEKGRQTSRDLMDTIRQRKEPVSSSLSNDSPSLGNDRSRVQHANSPSTSAAASDSSEAFKLQDVPKSKKAGPRRGSKSETRSPAQSSPALDLSGRTLSPQMDSSLTSSPNILDSHSPMEHKAKDESPTTSQGSSYSSIQPVERPRREDSLPNASLKAAMSRRDVPSRSSPTTPTVPSHERKTSAGGNLSQLNGGLTISSPIESPTSKSMLDPPPPPARSAGRVAPPNDTFTSPRAPPQPPPPPPITQNHRPNESISTVQSDSSNQVYSPVGLPRYSGQGDFSMDEEMARFMSNREHAEHPESQGGVLRRVSNVVRHGRSFSDRGSRTSSTGHKKRPTNGSVDISSPTVASPDSREEGVNLRNELRRAQRKIAELEAEKNGLQESVNSAADIKQANTMLREKRNTMAVLDTQREMAIRELEVMIDHLGKIKESKTPVLDINQVKSDIHKDFAASLQKLKDQLGGTIEDLIAKRTELTNEISNLIQMKDKGFQEYESLSTQNNKLRNMNADLISTIQSGMKGNQQHNGNSSIDGGRPPPNGLGIYHPHHKGGKSDISVDVQQLSHEPSYSNLQEVETEATLVSAPKVVNIQKAKGNKFNWKKGGKALTKNVTQGIQGINRAFASETRRDEPYDNIRVIGTPYGSVHSNSDMSSLAPAIRPKEKEELPRGWFGQKGNSSRPERLRNLQNNSNSNLAGKDVSNLYKSDLTARSQYEKRMMPYIITRCIQEVEVRGINVEGIYRKSGGTNQVNEVREGFEQSQEYDISDPDMDIHAVASALKKYLRELPVPLISFDIYDDFLNAGSIEDQPRQIKALTAAVNELPSTHRDVLEFLTFHLARVMKLESVNRMGANNLSVVFAPTLMRTVDPQQELTDMTNQRKAMQALLENSQYVFGSVPDS